MDKVNGKLTVYFEEPFWVGVFERIKDGKLSVAKVTFGAEPKDYEVLEYVQKHYAGLKFSLAVDTVVKDIERNSKMMQREARKQMQKTGIGTKSQQTSVYKGYKQDKIEMRGDRAEMSDFPLYLNTVAGGLDRRDQAISGFSFVVKIYAVPVVEIIG